MVRSRAGRPSPTPRTFDARAARAWIVALLLVHAALALWAMARNSVTFDENFHLPAGLMILERGDFTGSIAQPPLPKVLYALPAAVLGARLPDEQAMASGDEGTVGESFMRRNWEHYGRLYFASRLVALLFSLALAWLVWRWTRTLFGEAAGVLATALYALSPQAISFAAVVGTDLPTALAFTWVLHRLWRFLNAPGRRTWAWLAVAWSAAFLTRFSAVQLVPVIAIVALVAGLRGRLPSPRAVGLGLVALVPVAWLAVDAGYLFQLPHGPWSQLPFRSGTFTAFVHRLPAFGLPLPTPFLAGLDYMLVLNQEGTTYLLGEIHQGALWTYFPLALLFKLPLGTWGALLARVFVRPRESGNPHVPAGHVLGIAAAVLMAMALFLTKYNFGIRYLLPLLPLACIASGGLLAPAVRPAFRRAALAFAGLLAIETALAGPWFLSFFNWPTRWVAPADRLVNDSNVDWGQGLLALRDEMARRGIRRIHLAYHGTTDPAVYGIDYVPYLGGSPGPESDWIAVSSYFFVGLSQRMMTPQGRTAPTQLDFRPLWARTPDARPAGCMYLFHLPGRGR